MSILLRTSQALGSNQSRVGCASRCFEETRRYCRRGKRCLKKVAGIGDQCGGARATHPMVFRRSFRENSSISIVFRVLSGLWSSLATTFVPVEDGSELRQRLCVANKTLRTILCGYLSTLRSITWLSVGGLDPTVAQPIAWLSRPRRHVMVLHVCFWRTSSSQRPNAAPKTDTVGRHSRMTSNPVRCDEQKAPGRDPAMRVRPSLGFGRAWRNGEFDESGPNYGANGRGTVVNLERPKVGIHGIISSSCRAQFDPLAIQTSCDIRTPMHRSTPTHRASDCLCSINAGAHCRPQAAQRASESEPLDSRSDSDSRRLHVKPYSGIAMADPRRCRRTSHTDR